MSERRVLLIEPDASLASAYQVALQRPGFQVDVLADVEEAARRSGDWSPDLVVVDAEPAVGDLLCRKVRKTGRKTPVLLVSSNANGKRSLFGAHPDVVLQKPVSVEALLRTVGQLLGVTLSAPAPKPVTEADEIPLDSDLLEIVEEARTKAPSRFPRTSLRPTPPPVDVPANPEEAKKRELAGLRDSLKKRLDAKPATRIPMSAPAPTPAQAAAPRPAPAPAQAEAVPMRVRELEAERDRLKRELDELRARTDAEIAKLRHDLGALHEKQPPVAPDDFEQRIKAAEQERDKVWNELIAVMPRAEAAATLEAELEALRGAVSQREDQLRERDRRMAERDQLLADHEKRLGELDEQRKAAVESAQAAQTALAAAKEAAQTAQAASAPPPVFEREHEMLDLRKTTLEKDKQILELRGEIESRERTILDGKHAVLESDRRASALSDQILGLEQTLLTTREQKAALEAQIARLEQTLTATREETEREREHGAAALTAAKNEHERATTLLKRTHGDEVAALREAQSAERAELEARLAATVEAVRNQMREQLAAAETRRQTELAEADDKRRQELAQQAARNAAEIEQLQASHAGKVAEMERAHQNKLREQDESFRDLKLGMKQRHQAEVDELNAQHAARVAALEKEIEDHRIHIAALEAALAETKDELATRVARIAEFERELAATQERLQKALETLDAKRQLNGRARKALAVALTLLDEQTHALSDDKQS